MRKMLSLMVVLSVLVLVAAACSDDNGSDAADTPTTTTPSTSESSDTTTSTVAAGTENGGAGVEVDVSNVDPLGEILVDGEGITLYLNTNDTPAGPPTCTGGCADAWPPLLGDSVDVLAPDTLDAADFGTVERDDGTTQVTYFDHPLYYFATDAGPGEVNGQGIGGVWFVVATDGTPIPAG